MFRQAMRTPLILFHVVPASKKAQYEQLAQSELGPETGHFSPEPSHKAGERSSVAVGGIEYTPQRMSRSGPHPSVTPQPSLGHPERPDVYPPAPLSPMLGTPTKIASLGPSPSPSSIPRPVSASSAAGFSKKIGRRLNLQLRKGKLLPNKTRLQSSMNVFLFSCLLYTYCLFVSVGFVQVGYLGISKASGSSPLVSIRGAVNGRCYLGTSAPLLWCW